MIFFLSFLLSWLSGMFVILFFAFYSYDEFSFIDITSFAILTLAGSLLIIPILYQLVLKIFRKWMNERNQFIYFPGSLILIANIPVYCITWLKTGDLYGKDETRLFILCFITTAVVFGLCMAWKNRVFKKV